MMVILGLEGVIGCYERDIRILFVGMRYWEVWMCWVVVVFYGMTCMFDEVY